MKLIFLDIDGVLNNTDMRKKLGRKGVTNIMTYFDNKSLELLKELVRVSDAKIIISGTIRKLGEDSPEWKNLVVKLRGKGLSIYGKTGSLESGNRWEEICEYINEIKASGINIENFVILDDDNIEEPDLSKSHHVLTRSGIDKKDGFRYNHFIKALKILMGDDYIYVEGDHI